MSDERGGARVFWWSAAAALAVHAAVLVAQGPLHGGADLRPHLWLVQRTGESPGLHSVYAPAYHVLGALLAPVIGLEHYPRAFALLGAAALILGFRAFQRAAGLPEIAAALFPWSPYLFALSWCTPKIEAAGYGVAFAGLAFLARRRYVALGLCVVAAFLVHTAAGLFLGFAGLVLAAARRDARAVAALGAGAVAAAPLFAAHLAAGCTLAQSFLFSRGDYLREGVRLGGAARFAGILLLASPPLLAAAAAGARDLARRRPALAWLCAAVVLLYGNELWLAPFGARTTLDLLRGLTLLAFPAAIAAGTAVEGRPRAAAALLATCALWSAAALVAFVPDACFTRRHDLAEIAATRVDRCTFRWSGPRPTPAR